MNRIRHKDNDLRQLGYSGRLNFYLMAGQMVKILFSSLPGEMLKKIFRRGGLLKFFNFVLGIAGKLKFFIFLGIRAQNNFLLSQRSPAYYKIQYSR